MGTQIIVKKIRWVASVYGRNVPMLRGRAGKVEADLIWMKGDPHNRISNLPVTEDIKGAAFFDGSRIDNHTAVAIVSEAVYLGNYATVMDAEMLRVAMAWRHHRKVATDSQAAIGRIMGLRFSQARSWIEEKVIEAQKRETKEIV